MTMIHLPFKANHYLEMLSRCANYRKLVPPVHVQVVLHHTGVDFRVISLEALVDGFNIIFPELMLFVNYC